MTLTHVKDKAVFHLRVSLSIQPTATKKGRIKKPRALYSTGDKDDLSQKRSTGEEVERKRNRHKDTSVF